MLRPGNSKPPLGNSRTKIARAILAHGAAWKKSLGENFGELVETISETWLQQPQTTTTAKNSHINIAAAGAVDRKLLDIGDARARARGRARARARAGGRARLAC